MIPNDLVGRIDQLSQGTHANFSFTNHPASYYPLSVVFAQRLLSTSAESYLLPNKKHPRSAIRLSTLTNPSKDYEEIQRVLRWQQANDSLYDETIDELLTIKNVVEDGELVQLRPETNHLWKTLHAVVERNVAYHVLRQVTTDYQQPLTNEKRHYTAIATTSIRGVQKTNKQANKLQKILQREGTIHQETALDVWGVYAANSIRKRSEKQLPPRKDRQ